MTDTEWEQIIDQIDKTIVPTHLIKKVIFFYKDEPTISLDMDDLDAETLALFGVAITDLDDDDYRVRLMVDLNKLESVVSSVVDPLLKSLPKKA